MSATIVEAALFLAQKWPCFACDTAKRPITQHGFKDATRDPQAVREMFARPGAALIGVPTGEASDLAVIDLDVKHGAPGLEWLAANEHRLPETRQHATRSGGRHLLFRYPAGRRIRNSASRIAPGVDVRGEGGYIIVPPSDGYGIHADAMPAAMPAWLVDLLDPPRIEQPAPPPRRAMDGDGTPYGMAALRGECDAIRNAADGAKHDTLARAAYSIGGWVTAGELIEGAARAALHDALNAIRHRCEDFRSAEKTLADCFRAGMDAPRQPPARQERAPTMQGKPAPMHDRPAPMHDSGAHLKDTPPTPGLPLVYWEDIQPSLAADDFIEGLLIKSAMSVIYGPSNCGKTFWTSDLAMHVATGRRWQGRDIEPGGVIYCALEGGHGIRNRVAAWRKHYGLDGVEVPFAIIPVTLNLLDPDADAQRVVEAIEEAKRHFGFPVVWTIMDTLSRAMAGGNENSPEDMGALVTNGTLIQQATGSHLSWIHHSGKDQAQGARGHSLLRAATDTEIEISRPDKDSPSTAKVTKQRELEIEGEWTFSLKGVELGHNRRGKAVTSCVVVDADKGANDPAANLSPSGRAGLTALHEALITGGKPPASRDIPEGVKVVTLEAWRREFYARSHLDSPDAKRQAFHRAIKDLRASGSVAVMHEQAWLTKGNER